MRAKLGLYAIARIIAAIATGTSSAFQVWLASRRTTIMHRRTRPQIVLIRPRSLAIRRS